MHTALIFLADVLLLALVVVGICLLHSQHLSRKKADEGAQLLKEHMHRMELHKDCLIAHSRHMDKLHKRLDSFAGWLALERFKSSVLPKD